MDKAKEIGKEVGAVLDLFRARLERETGVKALLEPQPVKLHEPHIRIMAPVGWEFRFEDVTANEIGRLSTVRLDALVTLNAYGDGPDVYLAACIKASFRLNLFFRIPRSIPMVALAVNTRKALGAGNISFVGKRKPGGQHFRNEDEGKGEKPYLYEENFDVSVFFPYAEIYETKVNEEV